MTRLFVTKYPATPSDPPLSEEELLELRKSCAPSGALGFPSHEVIRVLRQHGYVEIVLEGLQVTSKGLERLVRERNRQGLS